ncbi:sulfotransferase family protein [Sphingopyxis sp. PET50]|uniref:sulfotransferase family protein n=1 Tax=Sphingopyxis sp. PET50 TaxID=2976533 RepID=UPI0021AEBA8E|nr:sulfotransferase family protein [Sphingopyxis sp. PET50]
MRKVFGIGFHKTGTTSLASALSVLGYRVTGPNDVSEPDIGETYLARTRALSEQFDAFQDNPWPLVYREMDAQWPDAKFILTLRDPASWIASQTGHFAHVSTPMREHIYGIGRGAPIGNEDHYVAVMEAHNAAVRDYFSDRPGKLLEMNLLAGDEWEKLCAFLDHPVPAVPFPHSNPAGGRRPLARAVTSGKMFIKRLITR